VKSGGVVAMKRDGKREWVSTSLRKISPMFWVEGLDFLILSRSFMSSVLIVRMSVMLEKMLDTSAVFNSPWALTGLTNTYAREDHLSVERPPSKM
jgi:hypothetical protein